MSALEFLSPTAAPANGHTPVARSPMEGKAQAAGARFEVRDGWNVAVDYAGGDRSIGEVAWADLSHLRKLELQSDDVPGELGEAKREGDAWICQLTPTRALLLGGDHAAPPDAVDVTTCFAALTILGPQARETIARFCALDLRPNQAPPQLSPRLDRTPAGHDRRRGRESLPPPVRLGGRRVRLDGRGGRGVLARGQPDRGRDARPGRRGGRECLTSSAAGACGAARAS